MPIYNALADRPTNMLAYPDALRATPRNEYLGALADLIAQSYSPQRTQQMQGTARFLSMPAISQTLDRLSYGEPLTTGAGGLGGTTRIRPEALEAGMAVAPMAQPTTMATLQAARAARQAALQAGRAGERYAERVVPGIMERGGMPAQMLQGMANRTISPMDVWHGSPHGPFTKFDPTKIGSGEGAQAFSYGHYLGQARGTGEEYRKLLSTKIDVNGKPLYDSNKIVGSTGNKDLDDYLVANLGDVTAARNNLIEDINYVGEGNPEAAKQMQKTLNELNKLKVNKQEAGFLYKVDLPDEAIAKMLDWDKPLIKQPNVMNALRSEAEKRVRDRTLVDIENDIRKSLPIPDIGDDYMALFSDANVAINKNIQDQALSKLNKMDLKSLIDKEIDTMKPADMNWNMTGKEFYELLSKREGSPEKASNLLQRQGVPGTRYLDQGSRNPGGFDTSNFVVYPGNEELLTIKEINDMPVNALMKNKKP
jgi:hypothetical protein